MAYRLGKKQFVGVLMLAETSKNHYFSRFAALADSENETRDCSDSSHWSFRKTKEYYSLLAFKGDAVLVLIAGRQVVTTEDLEVLILGTQGVFPDGLPIESVLREAISVDAVHVIPWGAGKWFFGRGKLLSKLINSRLRNGFYLGDQGGRPLFWPKPSHIRRAEERGIRILSGSDSLPFPEEVQRVGSFGFLMEVDFDLSRPAASIRESLRSPRVELVRFGHLQSPPRFLKNQVRMQMLKRRRGHLLSQA